MLQMFSERPVILRGLSINQRTESGRFIYLTVTKEFVLNHYIFLKYWLSNEISKQKEKRKKNTLT